MADEYVLKEILSTEITDPRLQEERRSLEAQGTDASYYRIGKGREPESCNEAVGEVVLVTPRRQAGIACNEEIKWIEATSLEDVQNHLSETKIA